MKCCVFIHKGNQSYFDTTVEITRRYSPSSRIVILGDESNEYIAAKYHVDHFLISNFTEDIPYYHTSVNPEEYEKFCFERWIIIKNFMVSQNIKAILHCDSDNPIFYNIEQFNYENALLGNYTLAKTVIPNVFFVTIDNLLKITSFYKELYSLEYTTFLSKIAPFATYIKNSIHYSDMYFLKHCITELELEFEILPESDEEYIFNTNFDYYKIYIDSNNIIRKFGTNEILYNIHFCDTNKDKIVLFNLKRDT
jgi:hypothetical protein